jgi:hypothetical protein
MIMLKSKIYSYCLILSTAILGVNATSVAAQNIKQTQETEAKNFLSSAIKTEQGYYFELNKFTSNLSDLQLTPPNDSYQYNVNIISDQKLVQVVASPSKIKGLRTFTAALLFNNENFSSNSIICKSERSTKIIASEIKLVSGQLQCPTGFIISFHNAQIEALGSIGATNRAQQAHIFETQNFTVNQQELGYTPSNTYYDYKLNLLENDQLAQVVATPKFDNLKSYIGGVFYEKNTGVFKSIACASKQPTKNIPQSIKFSNGKLDCPTGFKITAKS